MENLNLLYYKQYYAVDGGQLRVADGANDRLVNSVFTASDYDGTLVETLKAQHFDLKTVYPGLLTGIGYLHDIKSDDAAKIGFSFDYVTGQPYIPGSSIKGVLHHCLDNKEICGAFLTDFPVENEKKKKMLLEALFGGPNGEGGDVFLDAVVKCGGKDGKVLAFDSITHHESPIKAPNPVRILKVLPDVVFEFRFLLKDTDLSKDEWSYHISAGKKRFLYRSLLTEFGVGAKTNVGYGVLKEATKSDIVYPSAGAQSPVQQNVRPEQRKESIPKQSASKPWQGQKTSRHDQVMCPNCGKKNYRFDRSSGEERAKWKKKECFACGGHLPGTE